jgi:hypothetical protein
MEYGEVLSTFFVQVVFPILSAVIMVLISLVMKRLADKYGMEELLNHQNHIEALAMAAIGYAEEIAAVRLKNRETITGNFKMDTALGWLMSRSPEMSVEDAQQWIEAMLARTYNAGATGELTI